MEARSARRNADGPGEGGAGVDAGGQKQSGDRRDPGHQHTHRETHVERVLAKLGVENRVAAALYGQSQTKRHAA